MLTLSGPAFAQLHVMAVDIDTGPLRESLETLQRQTGIELLFDGGAVVGLESPRVQGNLTAETALRELLATTGLVARRADSGAWIVERSSATPLEQQDAAVAEILVVGRRTQNVDIRRAEDDIQPYVVVTRDEILRAHRDNIDQYFNSRVTANTQVIPASWALTGDSMSQINLRGLATNDTLVLVDGRRMPSAPTSVSGFEQSDLNGIPLHAIDRIEVLTGTAGGIHGFGALGGVVNIVLDREARGLDLFVTGGITSRHDAGHGGAEASYGFTSSDERTRLTAFAAYSETDPLAAGQRDYAARDRRMTARIAPDLYNLWSIVGNSVSVSGLGTELELKPEYGGGSIGSDHTYLPIGFAGDTAALGASLAAHAGQFDTSLPAGNAASDLGASPRVESLLFNVRHRFERGIELYADALVSSTRNRIRDGHADGGGLLGPDSPANPFSDFVTIAFPISDLNSRVSTRIKSSRYTAGLLAELPAGWRGTLETGFGGFTREQSAELFVSATSYLFLFGDPTDLDTNPFGDWATFESALHSNVGRLTFSAALRNRLEDHSLRLAGPLFNTSAGAATLTLLAQRRKEHVRPSEARASTELGETIIELTEPVPGRQTSTNSFHAELRAPLIAQDSGLPLVRGLDVQLAVRRDDQRNIFVENILAEEEDMIRLRPRFTGTAYTAGAKITPWPWLMLRTSYATGEQPPHPDDMRILLDDITPSLPYADPKRGGQSLGDDGPLRWIAGGSRYLKASRARTQFFGAVLSPLGVDGPTLAVDYSRIRRYRDVNTLTPQEILDHEDQWPERVTRAALSDADRALGFTGGPVVMLDSRRMNGGRVAVDAFDARAEWPLSLLGGRLRLYADATYHKSNRASGLFQRDIENAGFIAGPLRKRANGGFDWSTESLTVGANLQYFASYRLYSDGSPSPSEEALVIAQGSVSIPAQRYLDVHASWRLPLWKAAVEELSVNLGVVNVLDKSPPRETSLLLHDPGYSRYGDPRRRRFELVLTCRL